MKKYKVLESDLTSPFQGMPYEIGVPYNCPDFDESERLCSRGYYATDTEGLVYSLRPGKLVFECEVWGRKKVFDQFKQRFENIKVIKEVEDLPALLKSCDCGYNLYEACFPINPFGIDAKPVTDKEIALLGAWASVWDSVWASVRAYVSSLFPNIREWKYINHEVGVNPFQSCIDLWKSGFVPSFDGKVWRLHTKDGIAWTGEI